MNLNCSNINIRRDRKVKGKEIKVEVRDTFYFNTPFTGKSIKFNVWNHLIIHWDEKGKDIS